MALVLVHLTQWAPASNVAAYVHRAINDRPAHAAGRHLLSVIQAAAGGANAPAYWAPASLIRPTPKKTPVA